MTTAEARTEARPVTLDGVLSRVDDLKALASSEGSSGPLIQASGMLETLVLPLIPNSDPLKAIVASEAVFLLSDAGDLPNTLRLAEDYLSNPDLAKIHAGLKAVIDNIHANHPEVLAQYRFSNPSSQTF